MAKAKKVSYQLIPEDAMPDMYELMNDLIETVHEHLTNARMVLAWNLTWGEDVDGKVTLGKAKKASDLDRELAPYDFVIMVNQRFWGEANEAQRKALLDHELSHCEVSLDDNGDPKRDEKGRVVYRMRKHDIEEFSGVVLRNGIWKHDLEVFYSALKSGKQVSLLEPAEDEQAMVEKLKADPGVMGGMAALAPRKGSGISSVSIEHAGESITLTAEDGDRLRKHARSLRHGEARH